MGWRGEIELRDAENGHACAKRSHQVSVTTKLACALTVVALAAATITVGGSYGYVAIPTAGSVGMTSQVKNVSTVSPSEAVGARKKKLRQAPDAVAETHPRGINTQTGVDTKIAPKAVKDGDVQSDAPSTPSPTSLPYPTVTPKPTRWIRGCNRGRPLAEASIEQDPDVLSESADKTTQKKLVTSMANMMNEWEVEVSKLRGFRAEVEGGAHCDTFTKTQLGRDAIAEALIKQYPDVLKAPADVQKQLATSARGRDAIAEALIKQHPDVLKDKLNGELR